MPLTHDLSFTGLDKFVIVENYKAKSSKEEPKVVRKNNDALIIKEWVSDNKEKDVSQPKIEKKKDTPQIDLQDQRVINSGCSRHMIGNMSYLTYYEEIDGGYISFGGNPKGGQITRKDDYSRFTWVFFLATKDETSGILKSFITRIKNLVDHKVKLIRCDNGTEFKNREMDQFCEMKGILRQFSVARTPQQNKVAERRNRTLIKATRTMLADSKLPTTFWAEAVNTACYVQNRVLVVKPHNKTPYELFHSRTPTLSFMRLFRCPITILNTIDHLGKFNDKPYEGFFVGFSLNSKAFRVFNSKTRIAEENLHIMFSESTPNVLGSGPDWLFNIDALTRTMNYEPTVIGTQSNGFEDLLNGKRAIGTKWVFRNKKDKKGIVIRNKARLVTQGYIQEEGINYDEVFTSVVRIEAIRLFLAYASFKAFVVYQMDVKSAFLYGKIKEKVYKLRFAFERLMHEKFHMSSMRELIFFLGFQVKQKEDGIFISQDKYVAKILNKFRFTEVKTANTPMETQKPLLKDKDGEEGDVYMYRLMIGSLMYLISSRPGIMFAVCTCTRHQVNLKVSHLHAMKKIFRDLQLEDKEGIDCLPNSTILEQLALIGLKKRVKNLEKRNSSRTHKLKRLYKVGLSARVESSGDKVSFGEDASKEGMRIDAIDADEYITLVNDADKEMFNVDNLGGEEVFVARKNENVVEEVVNVAQVSTATTIVTITTEEITLAQALEALKNSKPKVKGIVFQEPEKKYPLTPPTLSMMLEKKLQIDFESEMAYQLCKLIKKQLKNLRNVWKHPPGDGEAFNEET
nr:ribonuclease H-like domain-containing protein [Tanacetum cinerariifolium]